MNTIAKLVFVSILGLCPAFCFAQLALQRQPLPSEAETQVAMKEVAKLYKKDSDAAKLPLQKRELARKMISDAAATAGDPASRYALQLAARRLAILSNDVPTIIKCTEATLADFSVDRAELQLEIMKDGIKKVSSVEENYFLRRWIEYSLAQLPEFNANTRRLVEVGLSLAKEAKNKEAIEEWLLRAKEQRELIEAQEALAAVNATLENEPLNSSANEKLGRHVAFHKNDWDLGIPLLAVGEEPALASLAGRDLLEPTGDQERLSLANDWYAWSEKQTNREKTAGALRAAYWYRQTLASLSGLEKTRVEKLIAEIEKSSGPFAKERWVELLDRTDLSRHKIEGVWERAAFLLESSGKTSWQTIALPVHIDSGSYELEVCLTNFSEELGIFCPGPEYPVEMAINCWFNAKTALGGIDKQEGKLSPSAVPAYKFDPQKIYFLNLRVERSAGLASYTLTINGKSYYVWKGRESSLFAGYQNNKHRLLIVSKRPQLSMLSARFRLLSNGVARFDTP